jgi:hypothetical protein
MSSSSATARVGALAGLLAVLAIPAAVVAAQVMNGVVLLRALYVGVPAAVGLALVSLLLARRARLAQSRRVDGRGRGAVRTARILAWAGLYAGLTGALALAVYGVLRLAE